MTMSLYVGLPISKGVASTLEKAQGGLHAGLMVPPSEMHVTVADLGEQSEDLVEPIKRELGAISLPPVNIEIDGLGTIGGNAPEELYAEVKTEAGLKNLNKMVGRAVREAGVPLAHTRYVPRVTMARFGAMGQHDLKQIMSFLSRRAALSAGPFMVMDFNLYGISDGPTGPEHTIVETFALEGF
ncbi:MAG: RNA 2',3'-cyclic phosphodiesterase [Pseudomonadota bacterium]